MEEKKTSSSTTKYNQATGVYISYSPTSSFFAEAFKVLLIKCLGFESKSQESISSCTIPNKKDDGKEASPPSPTKDPKQAADPYTDDPDPPKEIRQLARSRTPPISKGGGGKINSTGGS